MESGLRVNPLVGGAHSDQHTYCRLAGVEPVEYQTDMLGILSQKVRRVDIARLMLMA